ncbi:hypothetical protein ACFFSY_13850 [Paenibacillus aurantiacus]|uniref:Uncharacterized protein n=1 Tax=Paenibacillus aurantiacus TaxID=1936118 RepID=A0ABV5KSB5_9BACL
MPEYTENFNLAKPVQETETADINVINSNMDIIDTQLMAAQMGSANIAELVNEALTRIGMNSDVAGNTTLFALLTQLAAYTDSLEALIGPAGATAGTGSVFARLAQISGFTDTLEASVTTLGVGANDILYRIGLNTDAAGVSTLFARLAQIAAFVDTLETLVGATGDALGANTLFGKIKNAEAYSSRIGANNDAAGTGTVFARLAQLAAYFNDALPNGVFARFTQIVTALGATTDAASTTGTVHAKLAQLMGHIGVIGDDVARVKNGYPQYPINLLAHPSTYPASMSSSNTANTITSDRARYIYVANGQTATDNFWRYDTQTHTWAKMANIPVSAYDVALCYDGGNYIYAANSTDTTLRRYSISGNSWSSLAAHSGPTTIYGASLIYDGGDYLYYHQPYSNSTVQDYHARYSISGNSWALMASYGSSSFYSYSHGVYDGQERIYYANNSSNYGVFVYIIPNNSWQMMNLPQGFSDWTSDLRLTAAYFDGGDYIEFQTGSNILVRYNRISGFGELRYNPYAYGYPTYYTTFKDGNIWGVSLHSSANKYRIIKPSAYATTPLSSKIIR